MPYCSQYRPIEQRPRTLQGATLVPETAMVHAQNDTAYPTPEATESSCDAKRDAIQRANAEYLVSHGLYPANGEDEPAGTLPTPAKRVANRLWRAARGAA
jgi:hypothetical protein